MKKISITSSVVNGNLKRNRQLIIDALKSFEGKNIQITIEKATKKRSNQQNRYYWGILIPIFRKTILDAWGDYLDKETSHLWLKQKMNYNERVNEATGEVFKIPKSTTENTTTEQEIYHKKIRDFLFQSFNVDVPLPGEQTTLNF